MKRARTFRFLIPVVLGAFGLAGGLAGCSSHSPSSNPEGAGQGFSTPQAAVTALAQAVAADNQSAMVSILGSAAKPLVASDDPSADQQSRQHFTQNYDQMHRLARSSDGKVTLYIGAGNWPFPLPLIERGNQWYFDTSNGAQEILDRRIGRNEADTIAVCQQLIAAERQYQSEFHHYAQHFVSSPGQHDGLFWAQDNTAQAQAKTSPIGPLLAFASQQGAAKAAKTPTPFHGYYFRMLKGQKPGTYAFVAYPAAYRSSGVMTFLVTEDGVVYQRNLGPDTESEARAMTQVELDPAWERAD